MTPDFAVRIEPDLVARAKRRDLAFPGFRWSTTLAKHADVRAINQAVARCGEELVFFRDRHDWVVPFLSKNARFRIEPHTDQLRLGDGLLNVSSMRIASIA